MESMRTLAKIINNVMTIILILNLILWLLILIAGSEKDVSTSILIYLSLAVVPCCLYLGIRALLLKIFKTKKEEDKKKTSTIPVEKILLPKEFLHFCSIDNGTLLIKKCSRFDFFIYIIMYATIFVLFSMLALGLGGVNGVFFIMIISILIFSCCILTVLPLYFSNTTKIDFKNGQVDIKNALFFSSWSTYSINYGNPNLFSINKSGYFLRGWRHCCDVLLNIDGNSYSIKQFSGSNLDNVNRQALGFVEFLTNGLKKELQPENKL